MIIGEPGWMNCQRGRGVPLKIQTLLWALINLVIGLFRLTSWEISLNCRNRYLALVHPMQHFSKEIRWTNHLGNMVTSTWLYEGFLLSLWSANMSFRWRQWTLQRDLLWWWCWWARNTPRQTIFPGLKIFIGLEVVSLIKGSFNKII